MVVSIFLPRLEEEGEEETIEGVDDEEKEETMKLLLRVGLLLTLSAVTEQVVRVVVVVIET